MGQFVKGDVVVVPFPFTDLTQAKGDFETGGLNRPGHLRPSDLFTADTSIILCRAGRLRQQVVLRAVDRAVSILRG